MFPLEELNKSQQEAVLYNDGPSLVIAGAGSGKTRVLTYKIAYLLSQGVPATSILALTFTNKAAREMKTRISGLVGDKEARYLWMGTFHSICSRILRHEANLLGYDEQFTIYDSTDSKNTIKRIIKDMHLDDKVYKVNMIAARISMAKNLLMTERDYALNRDYAEEDKRMSIPLMPDIFRNYNLQLRQANAMDFDDLLFNMNLLLRDFSEVLAKYQSLFEYIFVDEYQDTNYAQYMIVKLLAEPQQHICVVGDDAQSIYSFRGADITHILRFQQQFPQARLFKLEQNYRSTKNIVNAANSLIKKNQGQIPKEVFSEKERGDLVHITQYADDRSEAVAVANQIARQHTTQKFPYDRFAVLYRTNAQSRVLEDALRKQNIPYKVYGSTSFYQRKEIKDVLAYMNLAVNPEATESLLRIINVPARGIGDTTIRKLIDAAREQGISLNTLLHSLPDSSIGISSAMCNRLKNFVFLLDSFREKAESSTAYEFATDVLQRSNLLLAALSDKSAEGKDRYDNLQEFLSSIHEQEEDRNLQGDSPLSVQEFLSEISLLTDQDEQLQDDTPRVSLMTVHSAKGLEFPVVFIVGMEDKLFPSVFAKTPYEVEEERRLFYVAITRAEEQCFISYAETRFRNGSVQPSSQSLFLRDIDEAYVKREQPSVTRPNWESVGFSPESKGPVRSSLLSISKVKESISSPKKSIQSSYSMGMRIKHHTFGLGTVLDTYSENGNEVIKVKFDGAGEKKLLLKFAKLEII